MEEEEKRCDKEEEVQEDHLFGGGGLAGIMSSKKQKRQRTETLSEAFQRQWFAVPANQKAVDETIQLLLAAQMCLWPEEEDVGNDKALSPGSPGSAPNILSVGENSRGSAVHFLTPSVRLTLNSKQCSKQQLMVALDTFAQSEDCETEIWYLVYPNQTHYQHRRRILMTERQAHDQQQKLQRQQELQRQQQQQQHWAPNRRGIPAASAANVGGFDPFTGERLVAPDYDAAGNPLKLSAIKEPEFDYHIELVVPASIFLSPPAVYPPHVATDQKGANGGPMERYEPGSFGVPLSLRPTTTKHQLAAGAASLPLHPATEHRAPTKHQPASRRHGLQQTST